MGRFVNPDNSAFQVALNAEIYLDKTGLIAYANRVLDTPDAYICNSRPMQRICSRRITAEVQIPRKCLQIWTLGKPLCFART